LAQAAIGRAGARRFVEGEPISRREAEPVLASWADDCKAHMVAPQRRAALAAAAFARIRSRLRRRRGAHRKRSSRRDEVRCCPRLNPAQNLQESPSHTA
jgi:hypothetical protein